MIDPSAPRFASQVAVVTGGADGLGKAIAQRLAQEGARIVLFDRHPQRLESARAELSIADHPCAGIQVEVTDDDSLRDAFAEVLARHSRLDILVHCAGIVGPNGRKITEVETADFDETIAVNLRGSFLACKHALRTMLPRNYGRILLIASIAGKEGNAGMAAYSASKAGVIGLVKSAGKEFAETGITVNALAPAVVRTAMVDAMDPAQVRYMTDKIPMKRCGTLDEVAAIACWIVSPEASFNTGVTFDLTGGRATY